MRARRITRTAVIVTIAIGLLCTVDFSAAQKGGKKPKNDTKTDTTELFRIEFPDVPCTPILPAVSCINSFFKVWGDKMGSLLDPGAASYLDERVDDATADPGVRAFLYGSGSLGFRTHVSPNRTLTIDFDSADRPLIEGATLPFRELTPGGFPTRIHTLNAGRKLSQTVGPELGDTPEAWLSGDSEQQCHDENPLKSGTPRGILCITPGASRAASITINWHSEDKTRTFKIQNRDNQWVDVGADNGKITRCCDSNDGNQDGSGDLLCDNSLLPIPNVCKSPNYGGVVFPIAEAEKESLDFTWVYSTKDKECMSGVSGETYDLNCSVGQRTGPVARVTSDTSRKGKPITIDFGRFEMPMEFVIYCRTNCSMPQ